MENTQKGALDKKIPLALTIEYQLSVDVFASILITALEGGSNYWYYLPIPDDKNWERLEKYDAHNGPYSEAIAKALFNDPEFELVVTDAENPDERLGVCTQASILAALKKTAEENKQVFINILNEEYDANDADYVFQLAVMGEVQFS